MDFDAMGRLTMYGLALHYREVLGLNIEPAKSVDEMIEFIRNLDNNAKLKDDYFLDWFMELRNESIDDKDVAHISKGAYGSVYPYKDPELKDRVIKEQFDLFKHDEIIASKNKKCRDFFIETLIHTLLCNDLQFGKYIPKIYGAWASFDATGNAKSYTEMQRIEGHTVFREFGTKATIDFAFLQSIVQAFSAIMAELYNRYKFIHLDFKLGNIALDGKINTPKIFDFGSGCIEFEGLKIRAKAFIKSNISKSSCSRSSDFGLFFVDLALHFYGKLDDKSKRFLEGIINIKKSRTNYQGNKHNLSISDTVQMVARTGKPKNAEGKPQKLEIKNMFLAAYNYHDTLYEPYHELFAENVYQYSLNFEKPVEPTRRLTLYNRQMEKERGSRSRSRSRERKPPTNTHRNRNRDRGGGAGAGSRNETRNRNRNRRRGQTETQ